MSCRSLLRQAEEHDIIQGIQICNGAPKINHLFFADDSLIVMKATAQGAARLQSILALYESQSGQMVNKNKSTATFSNGTTAAVKSEVLHILGIPHESRCKRYLGLPVHVGAAPSKEFEYIKQMIWQRMQGWTERLLSKPGKETLVESVAQAIPTFTMSCFDLTKKLCEEIGTLINRYWWSQQDKMDKCHWIGWDKLTKSKKKGGLGFRELHIFNLAVGVMGHG